MSSSIDFLALPAIDDAITSCALPLRFLTKTKKYFSTFPGHSHFPLRPAGKIRRFAQHHWDFREHVWACGNLAVSAELRKEDSCCPRLRGNIREACEPPTSLSSSAYPLAPISSSPVHVHHSLNPYRHNQLHIAVAPYVLQTRRTTPIHPHPPTPTLTLRFLPLSTLPTPLHSLLLPAFTPHSCRFFPGFLPNQATGIAQNPVRLTKNAFFSLTRAIFFTERTHRDHQRITSFASASLTSGRPAVAGKCNRCIKIVSRRGGCDDWPSPRDFFQVLHP